MEKGKAREWTLCWRRPDGVPFTVAHVDGPIAQTDEEIKVREVIELTDDEKRQVDEVKFNIDSGTSDEKFLLSLLERAGVINE